MIVIRMVRHCNCPLIRCDTCGVMINKERPGIVSWNFKDENNLKFAHKGACDRRDRKDLSEELGTFLSNLRHNSMQASVEGGETKEWTTKPTNSDE